MLSIQRILVPVDFSPGARAACDLAVQLAETFGAIGTLLHVWSLPQPVRPDLMVSWDGGVEQPMTSVMQRHATDDMQGFLATLPETARSRFQVLIEEGEVTRTILAVAEREQSDMIVIGTHGRTGLSHLLLGSVAERVVRHARCPVLSVRLPEMTGSP